MKPHSFITVIIPFRPAFAQSVDDQIELLAEPGCGNRPHPRLRLQLDDIGCIHYMSITVVRPQCPFERYEGIEVDDPQAMAHLVLEISSDNGPRETLAALAERFGDAVDGLLQTADVDKCGATLADFLVQNNHEISATSRDSLGQVHCGNPGQGVQRIRREHELAEKVEEILRRDRALPAWHRMSPRKRLEKVRDELWSMPDGRWKWAFVPEPAPCLGGAPPSDYSLFNVQARKALACIVDTFTNGAWPLPFFIVAGVFILGAHFAGITKALVWSGTALAGLVAGTIALLAVAYLRLRHLERIDACDDKTPKAEQVADLMKVENFCGQNSLASVSRLKRGLLRRLTLRLAFAVVGSGRFVQAPGFLGKNGVIHFARWIRLEDSNQLLFFSNFDDSWESYVADFIADAPSGVSAIWSNCVGFPRTRALFGGGANDRDRLVRWARRQQHPTKFWYRAYEDITAARIRINAAIRQGIASAESQQDCEDWLSLFGSTPRPVDMMYAPEIPTLVFGGLSRLRFGHAMLLKLQDANVSAARSLLDWIHKQKYAVFGENPNERQCAMIVGLAATGLKKCGVPDESLATFPVAFQQGMDHPDRSRHLCDVGGNAPCEWKWGRQGKEVDLIVLVYATEQYRLDKAVQQLREELVSLKHAVAYEQPLAPLRDKYAEKAYQRDKTLTPPCGIPSKEPFGFEDGVSQPIIRNSPRSNAMRTQNDLVEAGEFVFGYPDNTGLIPPSPLIPASFDPKHMLPDAGTDALRKRPDASTYEGDGWRDFGANGTFLVVRQLEQDVKRYQEWLDKAVETVLPNVDADPLRLQGEKGAPVTVALRGPEIARSAGAVAEAPPSIASAVAGAPPGSMAFMQTKPSGLKEKIAREIIQSKIVGRWEDGASLMRYHCCPSIDPDPDSRTPDNDYTYAEDPTAIKCPFGSHIRRANPRDTRYPGSADEIAATNRHRLLRVGRVYGRLDPNDCRKLDPGEKQGLLFMCLNADIERQFEFVQKTWLLNASIHGLRKQVDPILGVGEHEFSIPTAYGPIDLPPLPQIVSVIGGGYFFMPSRATFEFLASADAVPVGQPIAKAVEAEVGAE